MTSKCEPVAWLHTMHMEFDQLQQRVTLSAESTFGVQGTDYSQEYEVTTEPLYRGNTATSLSPVEVSTLVEKVLYSTVDMAGTIPNCPALTTLLYKVCGNDGEKFDEASRLVQLFVRQALTAK